MPSYGNPGVWEFSIEFPEAPDTVTSSVFDLCSLASADPLGLLAAWAVLQGYSDLSLTPVVDVSRDIPVAAALSPGLLPLSRDSVVPAGTRSEETEGSGKNEEVSLEEDHFLADTDTDVDDYSDDGAEDYEDNDETIIDEDIQVDSDYGSDYDSDCEDDDDNDGRALSIPDESFLGKNFRTDSSFLGHLSWNQIGDGAFSIFQFDKDTDGDSGPASLDNDLYDPDTSDSDSSDSDSSSYSDLSDFDSNDSSSSDSDSTDDSDKRQRD